MSPFKRNGLIGVNPRTNTGRVEFNIIRKPPYKAIVITLSGFKP